MSLGYAEKLSFKEDVGVVGMPELYDSPDILQAKIEELATFIQQSKHLVAFTGAGISTSCGIPDFRGPHGIWTLQREGKPLPKADVPFHRAVPGLTHMALAALEKAGILKFVISQNIDGLHLRSDLPRDKLAELHGNSFREVCSSCRKEYIRDFEVETIGLKETGRRCCESNCRGKLIDTVLDWEDALPPKEMAAAEKHCKIADLFLCLGTSLQITPACNLPLKSVRAGGKLVIVNLQPTPKDKKAALLIHAHVDKVIRAVMQILNLSIPPHVQVDHVQISLTYLSKRKQHMKWRLKVLSTHGDKVPLPFLKLVEISFPDRSDLKPAFLKEQPFSLIRGNLRTNPLRTLVKLIFGDGVGCSSVSVEYPIDFQKNVEYFDHGKDTVIKNLRCKAIEESSCGHVSPIQQRFSSGLNGVITDYAIVTGFMKYETTLMIDFKCQKENGGTNKRCLQDIDDAEICIASKKAKEF